MFTVADIAKALSASFEGAGDLHVSSTAEPQSAGPTDLAIATNEKYLNLLECGQAKAALVTSGCDWQAYGLKAAILVERPRYSMAALSKMFDQRWRMASGVHPTAQIDTTAKVEGALAIGPFCVIGPGTTIGPGAWIGSHVSIGAKTHIGAGATLMDGVKIGQDVSIGDNFIAQPGVVVAADGFSFVTAEPSAIESVRETLGDRGDSTAQPFARIHSLGSVTIGDDVELGANSCVDRGTIRETQIGNGVKVDNLAQIGHNVVIGDDSLICAQVGIAGSTRIGRNVVLGGQTGVSDNVFIGDGAITGGATKVLSNVPAGRVMLGYPAVKMETQLEMHRALRRLPRMMAEFTKLKTRLSGKD